MDMISNLAPEVLQNIFLHLDNHEKEGRAAIFNCLTVSKHFYQAMRGAPLLDNVVIRCTRQIPQLVTYLTKNLLQAQYIKVLTFNIEPDEWDDADTMDGRIRLTNDISPISFLLNLTSKLRRLMDVPILAGRYEEVLDAMLRLPQLLRLSCKDYREAPEGLLRALDLQDVHRLSCKLEGRKAFLRLVKYRLLSGPGL